MFKAGGEGGENGGGAKESEKERKKTVECRRMHARAGAQLALA